MALLNLRDKVIEARVACVGIDLDFVNEHLGSKSRVADESGERMVVEVGPLPSERLRDCALRLQLVSERSESSPEALRSLLDAADGIVIALDADSAARNASTVSLVREVLTERRTPVVLQWSTKPTDDIEVPLPLVSAHESGQLTIVNAPTRDGRGVDETLKQVVDVVIESMTQGTQTTAPSPDTSSVDRRDERNPLLGALQRVLERTAEAQADKLAEGVSERVERALAETLHGLVVRIESVERAQQDQSKKVDELQGAVRELSSTSAALRRGLDAIAVEVRRGAAKDALLDLTKTIGDLTKTVGELEGESRAQLSTIAATVPELPSRLERIDTAGRAGAHETAKVTERLAVIDTRVRDALRWMEAEHPRLERVEALVNELVEEAKKSKRGWFG